MRTIAIATLILGLGTGVRAAESVPALAPQCFVFWDVSGSYAHGVLCIVDADSGVPPTTLPSVPLDPIGEASGTEMPPQETQQKSRRLPGGFLELDVKKSD